MVSAHREENVDSDKNFNGMVATLNAVAEKYQTAGDRFHPPANAEAGGCDGRQVPSRWCSLLKPLGFKDYNKLQLSAKAVMSDSGTINEESSILNFPALNLRDAHERPEGMEEAAVMMTGMNEERVMQGLMILESQASAAASEPMAPSGRLQHAQCLRQGGSHHPQLYRLRESRGLEKVLRAFGSMRIALIADTFPPLRTSGAVQLRDLAREFVRQGHELTVLLPAPGLAQPWGLEDFEGARVLRLRAPRTKDIGYVRRTIGEFMMPFAMYRNLKRARWRTSSGMGWSGMRRRSFTGRWPADSSGPAPARAT